MKKKNNFFKHELSGLSHHVDIKFGWHSWVALNKSYVTDVPS